MLLRNSFLRTLNCLVHRPSCCLQTMADKAQHSKGVSADRLKGTESNVWVEFIHLAAKENATNLGQGFPDYAPASFIRESFRNASQSDDYKMFQYTRGYGHPRLVQALSNLYSPLIGHGLDPNLDILVTVGGYGALSCVIQGIVNPGDEVIIIEPFFDCYRPMVSVAGGTAVYVPLRPKPPGTSSDDFVLDLDELRSKFTSRTKAIILNNPNNPLGKVFTKSELEQIASICIENNVIAISDEVYEFLIYPPLKHIRIASLPGMHERTVTIGSAGKALSATGCKVGWVYGAREVIRAAQIVHQNTLYVCPTAVQEGVAQSLESPQVQSYWKELANELQDNRQKIHGWLEMAGFQPVLPQGGYFMMAKYNPEDLPKEFHNSDEPRDFSMVKWMTKHKKLAAIPPSAFYSTEHQHLGEDYVRFCSLYCRN